MAKNKALETLSLFRTPRIGALVLSCEKCRRRLAENGRSDPLAKLTEAITATAAATPETRLRHAPCMGECPEDGITLCALVAGSYTLPQPAVVRSPGEVAHFFAREIGPPNRDPDPVVSEAGLEPATVSLEG